MKINNINMYSFKENNSNKQPNKQINKTLIVAGIVGTAALLPAATLVLSGRYKNVKSGIKNIFNAYMNEILRCFDWL